MPPVTNLKFEAYKQIVRNFYIYLGTISPESRIALNEGGLKSALSFEEETAESAKLNPLFRYLITLKNIGFFDSSNDINSLNTMLEERMRDVPPDLNGLSESDFQRVNVNLQQIIDGNPGPIQEDSEHESESRSELEHEPNLNPLTGIFAVEPDKRVELFKVILNNFYISLKLFDKKEILELPFSEFAKRLGLNFDSASTEINIDNINLIFKYFYSRRIGLSNSTPEKLEVAVKNLNALPQELKNATLEDLVFFNDKIVKTNNALLAKSLEAGAGAARKAKTNVKAGTSVAKIGTGIAPVASIPGSLPVMTDISDDEAGIGEQIDTAKLLFRNVLDPSNKDNPKFEDVKDEVLDSHQLTKADKIIANAFIHQLLESAKSEEVTLDANDNVVHIPYKKDPNGTWLGSPSQEKIVEGKTHKQFPVCAIMDAHIALRDVDLQDIKEHTSGNAEHYIAEQHRQYKDENSDLHKNVTQAKTLMEKLTGKKVSVRMEATVKERMENFFSEGGTIQFIGGTPASMFEAMFYSLSSREFLKMRIPNEVKPKPKAEEPLNKELKVNYTNKTVKAALIDLAEAYNKLSWEQRDRPGMENAQMQIIFDLLNDMAKSIIKEYKRETTAAGIYSHKRGHLNQLTEQLWMVETHMHALHLINESLPVGTKINMKAFTDQFKAGSMDAKKSTAKEFFDAVDAGKNPEMHAALKGIHYQPTLVYQGVIKELNTKATENYDHHLVHATASARCGA